MKVKIFANNINHLTDARYFAAWGASWMCYNVTSLSLTEIAAIKEWVAGPKHIINVVGIDPSEAAAMLTNEAVEGYLTDNVTDHRRIQSLLQREVEAFIIDQSDDHASTIRKVNWDTDGSYTDLLCKVDGNPSEVINFVEKRRPLGIVLSGTEEEVVGVKSLDELDEILELLEDKEL